jgi:predicted AAA+ superfamily ATPase
MTTYQHRLLEAKLQKTLDRGKSILLLGPRQTGKTTLLHQACSADLNFNLAIPKQRLQFEREPDSLSDEIEAFWTMKNSTQMPRVIIDEIQKSPILMDVIQYLIDNKRAQFILTGSSARKLKFNRQEPINLLPGRVAMLHLDALTLPEMNNPQPELESLLLYGSLPGIYFDKTDTYREEDLMSYVEIYLEEEIRQEALVRNLGAFSKFLELSAITLGEPVNFTRLSQDIGVSVHLIIEYYQILEDCLIIDRINPISTSSTRRKLTKAPKYLFFDLGVRRLCAKEGRRLSQRTNANLFEQFVGMEILRYLRLDTPNYKLNYWRDHNGPEVDYVIDMNHQYLPIEVKWTQEPTLDNCRHLEKFMEEYPCDDTAYVICRVERPRKLSNRIMALPWQDLPLLRDKLNKS